MSYLPVDIDAKYIKDYQVQLDFDNGERKIFDCGPYLKGEIFEPLKNIIYFQNFFVDGWTISWPNGADFSPEILYEKGVSLKS